MRLIIRFPDGRRAEALLLAESADWLRVTMPGYDDAIDLRRSGGSWIDESGQRVSIEAMLTPPVRRFAAVPEPRPAPPKPPAPQTRRAASGG